MSLTRRQFLRNSALGIGAVVGGHLLAACGAPQAASPDGSNPAVPSSAPAQAQETVQLRYAHWGSEDEKASTKATLDAFMKANPNIVVEQMYIPESGDPYLQKMTTMAASNTLPDAALFPDANTIDWALKGQFLDLTDIFKGEHEKVEAIQYRTPDGRIAGVAGAQEINLLWYNKALFDEVKVDYPPAAAKQAWQWDQFVQIAKQLTLDTSGRSAADTSFDPHNIDRFGFQMGLWDMPLLSIVRSNGGEVFSDDFRTVTLDRPENIQAIQMIADLMLEHHVMPAFNAGGDISSLSTDNALLSKKVAMKMDGQWALETMNRVKRESQLNFGIGVLPYLKQPVTAAVGGPIVAFKSSKHPDEAMKLVSFIMDPHNTPAYIKGGLWMPNEKRWYEDPALLNEWIGNENHPQEYKTAVVDYALGYVTKPMPIYRVPGWPAMWQLINPALEQVWLGKQKAEQAIKEVAPKVEDYFKTNVMPLLK
jgi:multiple sugar transport system substrate-binding protein